MFEVLKIRMHEKKSLFEVNEKVLRSSFKIIFGVRTARVFELKKNLPYPYNPSVASLILYEPHHEKNLSSWFPTR